MLSTENVKFEYKGKTYTRDTLAKLANKNGYSTEDFINAFMAKGMKQIGDEPEELTDSEQFANIFSNASLTLQNAWNSTQLASVDFANYLGIVEDDYADNFIEKEYSEIEAINKKYEDTGKGIVGGLQEGDYADVALGIVNALTSVVTTVAPAIATRGISLIPQIMAPMYTEYNAEKAKTLYGEENIEESIRKLRENEEDEVVVPFVLGAAAVALEKIGIKGISKYITNQAKNKTAKNIVALTLTGNKEGLTEYFQGGLNAANLASAKGKDPLKATYDHLTSKDALEEYLQGFVGGAGMSAGGRAINSAIRSDQDNLVVNSYITRLGVLQQEKVNSKTERNKKQKDKEIKKLEKEFKSFLTNNQERSKFITEEQSKELLGILDTKQKLNNELSDFQNQFKNGELNENEFNDIVKGIENDIKAENDKAESIRVEANKKFLMDDLRVSETAINKVLGLEQKIYKTEQEFLDAYNAKTNKNYTLNDIDGVDGLIVGNEIMINVETAAKNNAVTVGSHELLHGILKSSLTGSKREIKKDGKVVGETDLTVEGEQLIKDFLDTLSKKERAVVDKRIDNNYKYNRDKDGKIIKNDDGTDSEKQFAEYAEEYLNAYADAAIKNEITDSLLVKIGNFLSKIFNSGNKGYKNLEFKTGKDVKTFLKAYVSDRKKGKFRKQFVEMAQEGAKQESTVEKKSRSKAVDAVNKMEKGATTKEEFQKPGIFNNIYNSITQDGGAINNYVKSLGLSKEKFQETIDSLSDRLMNYDPATQRKTKSGEKVTIGEFLMANIGFAKLDAAKKLAIEGKKEGKTKRIDAAKKTKEGEATFDIEDTDASAQEILDEQDMSVEGVAKREAKENKAKKKRNSKLRQDLGFETDGDAYNKVLDSARKSLLLAYKKTTNIKDAKARVDKIVQLLKKEYNSLTSDLFKPLKNFLGVKDYLSNLKKHKEAIIEAVSTADLVQMERNVPDADKVFVVFERQLTTQKEVQDAVDKNLLPKDDLNRVSKGPVNLYRKVMPTDNEIVGFADQPAINPETGQRSGLKGTRKDGFAKRIAETLILDAVMEVRQETEVQKTLTEDLNVEMDVQQLASKIGRDVNVKFSKSNAVADIDNAIDVGTDTGVYLQVRFSKSHREQYENRLKKNRTDLTEKQRKNAVQSVFDFVDGKDIPNNKKSKYEKMAMHYMANGHLILPEDGYKVIEAERIATQKKLDPFSFKNPNVLIETYVGEVKGTRTNPDNVKTFTNKTELTSGVTVYDVENSKQGQLDTRKVIDTHFGKESNPWCLAARKKVDRYSSELYIGTKQANNKKEAERMIGEARAEGNDAIVTEGNVVTIFAKVDGNDNLAMAWPHWKSYNKEGNGHQIAFHNGKLVAFRDGNQMQWWDRNDKPSNAVVVKGKKVGDGFREVVRVDENKSTVLHTEKQTGDKKNGTYIKKNLDGNIVEITTKKDNFKYGKQFKRIEKTYYTVEITTFYNAKSFNRGYDITSREEVRIYRKFKGKSDQLIKTGFETQTLTFGRDQIRLGNITKWQKNTIVTNAGTQDPGAHLTTTIVEGTVNQEMFEESQNPDAITDPFIKKNLKYLVVSNERYFPLQGKKVSVKSVDGANVWDNVLTIDNEVQETRIRFSRSANNEVKFSLSEFEQNRKTLPAILKKQIEVKERISKNPTEEDLYLLDRLSDLEFAIENNLHYEEAFAMFEVNLPEDVSSLLVDFKDIDSFESYIQDVSVPAIRTLGLNAAKAYFKNKFDSLTTTKDKVDLVIKFLKNIGISVRGDAKALEVSFTNQRLLEGPVTEVFGKEFVSKHFEFTKIKEGEKKGKTITYSYDGKEGSFEKVELYTDIEKIKNSRGDAEVVKQVNDDAKEANEFIDEIIDSDLSISERLAIIDLLSLNQRGAIRKSYTFGETVTDKVKKPASELVLEHEITVKNMTKYLRQRIKGILTQEQLVEIRSQAKIHVWDTKIDDILNAEKTTDGKSLRYEGGRSRYQNAKVKNYLISQFEKGLITGVPVKINQILDLDSLVKFSRSTNNPTKGITILDFDDTLATSSSLIRYTRPDGTTGTLTPEQYASTYEDLLGLGYEFDFSEFNKVVDGKPAPLLNKAKKLAGKFGTKNMFILTARPAESAVAIQKFLKENGLDIPIENITGLGNSTAEAKALWVLGKAAEGYNDFYFADDALQNVQAVENILKQLNVKQKVQRAVTVKFSKSGVSELVDSKEYKSFRNKIKNRKIYHGGTKNLTDPKIKEKDFVTWFYIDDKQGSSEAQTMAELWGINAQKSSGIYESSTDLLENQLIVPDMNDVPAFQTWVQENYPDIVLTKYKGFDGEQYESVDIISILNHKDKFKILKDWIVWTTDKKNSADILDVTGENLYDDNGNVSNVWPVIVIGKFNKNNIKKIKLSEEGKYEIKQLEKYGGVKVKFSKSSLRGNKAVQNMLDQIDVKSKVQQARVKFSKSMDKDFNNILEDVSGIESKKRFSEAKARRRGRSKGKFRYFVPPSHEDFIGLLYNFMGKGEKGNQHRNFFEKSLVRPLNRAYRALNAAKQAIANDYRALIKGMPEVRKKLGKKILDGDYTHEDAIRVYLWDKAGFKIPGLSKTDQKKLSDFVKNDPALQSFADALGVISKDKDGYVKPSDNWDMGGIKYDLVDATGRIGRAQFFQEFIENADIIFSKENLNKIEAIYGEDFRSALEDMLYRVTNGTNRPTGTNKIVNRWIDWINGSVGATMFFNARSAILQQLSFVNFMNFADNNIFKAAARFADQPQFWADFTMIFNSDYLKQRRTGAGFDVNASEIAREVSGSKEPVRAAIRYILNLGFLPTQMGDSFAIAIGGASFYRNRVNTYLKQGLSQKEAESKAFIDFQEIAEETQQSARPDMISQQQASFLGRFVLAFQNVTSQYVRIIKKSGLDLINRRISKGYTSQAQSDMANVSRIMYYGAIQSVIFYGLQSALFAMMFDDDERDEEFFEKKKDRMIHGTIDSILRGAGVFGAILSTIKNTAKKYLENQKSDSWFKSEAWPELLQISPPVGIKVRKISGAERTASWNKDVMKEMETFDIDNPLWDAVTSTIEGVTNVPLNRLHRKIQNLRAAQDSENAWWQRVAVVLGWSKWDVGIEDKKVEEVKKKIKKDKSKKKKTKEEQIQEKENEKKQKKERKEGKETTCIAVTSKGNRCSNKPEGNGKYCTIHAKVEQNKSGEKKQCKKTKSDGKRCKMQTSSKSGYCYYHD